MKKILTEIRTARSRAVDRENKTGAEVRRADEERPGAPIEKVGVQLRPHAWLNEGR